LGGFSLGQKREGFRGMGGKNWGRTKETVVGVGLTGKKKKPSSGRGSGKKNPADVGGSQTRR